MRTPSRTTDPAAHRTDDTDPVRVTLLHGMGGRATVWDRLAERLAGSGLELWDAELPWCSLGDRGWSRNGEPGRVVTETVGASSVVIAHSYSANLLVEELAAGRLSPRPTVLISPFYRPDPDDFDWPTITYYLNEFDRTFAEALRVGTTGHYPEAQRRWMTRHLRDHIGPYGWMQFFGTYLHSPFVDLSALTAPTLVVTGTADEAASPDDGRAMAEQLPDGRFEPLESCGHFPMLEQPDALAGLVSGFVRSLTGHDTDAYASDDWRT